MRHFREFAGDVLMVEAPTIEITYIDLGDKGIEYIEWKDRIFGRSHWAVPKPDADDLARGCHQDGIPIEVRKHVARLAMGDVK